MKPRRFKHVEGVVEMADRLARQYAPPEVMRCRIAAWLHDVAKPWDDADLLAYAEQHGEAIHPVEREVPMLLHGLVGYLIGAEEFGLEDPVIKVACASHTTGSEGLDTVGKIIYLADLIEPGRDFPGVVAIRQEAERNLDSAVLFGLEHTVAYLLGASRVIDPRTVLLRNELVRAGVTYRRPE